MNSEAIGAGFARSRAAYHAHAHHQRELAVQLAANAVQWVSAPVSSALEIGCGTGFLTEALRRHWRQAPIADYWLNDLVLADNLQPPAQRVHYLQGDISSVTLPDDVQLLLSSSALQWVADLPALLHRLRVHLATDALVVVSLYCGEHYRELRDTLGIGLPYWQVDDLRALFSEHFTYLWQREVRELYHFTTPHAVLKHIRLSGVGHLREQVTFNALRQFTNRYQALHDGRGYPLTYHAYQFIGRLR
ncbi:methyltransferase domain-containing protein [Cardiobacteriaceae bacterium TAE3-ERU3]|nr:methyltransferase domain-containing protein [Cardiobacteriaceae bacterium TAE3-ERU3]